MKWPCGRCHTGVADHPYGDNCGGFSAQDGGASCRSWIYRQKRVVHIVSVRAKSAFGYGADRSSAIRNRAGGIPVRHMPCLRQRVPVRRNRRQRVGAGHAARRPCGRRLVLAFHEGQVQDDRPRLGMRDMRFRMSVRVKITENLKKAIDLRPRSCIICNAASVEAKKCGVIAQSG